MNVSGDILKLISLSTRFSSLWWKHLERRAFSGFLLGHYCFHQSLSCLSGAGLSPTTSSPLSLLHLEWSGLSCMQIAQACWDRKSYWHIYCGNNKINLCICFKNSTVILHTLLFSFIFVQGKNVMFKENETRYETIIQIVTAKPFAVDRLKSLCCPWRCWLNMTALKHLTA